MFFKVLTNLGCMTAGVLTKLGGATLIWLMKSEWLPIRRRSGEWSSDEHSTSELEDSGKFGKLKELMDEYGVYGVSDQLELPKLKPSAKFDSRDCPLALDSVADP